MQTRVVTNRSFLDFLSGSETSLSAELRPPRANSPGSRSMDDWIDTYHSIRRLTLAGTHVFITDNAVGQQEEENLRHLVANLGPGAIKSNIIPFLTCKHSLDYCLRYAERAFAEGFRTLVVLGGDTHDGIPRCVGHAYQLREKIRKVTPGMLLGGWANPHKNIEEQGRHLAEEGHEADFFLTQIVSHHNDEAVARFRDEVVKRGVRIPGIYGVFFYRSARRETLQALRQFIPVPAEGLRKEFEEEKLGPEAICARSIEKLHNLGISHIYVSNLPVADAPVRLEHLSRITGLGPGSPGAVPTLPTARQNKRRP